MTSYLLATVADADFEVSPRRWRVSTGSPTCDAVAMRESVSSLSSISHRQDGWNDKPTITMTREEENRSSCTGTVTCTHVHTRPTTHRVNTRAYARRLTRRLLPDNRPDSLSLEFPHQSSRRGQTERRGLGVAGWTANDKRCVREAVLGRERADEESNRREGEKL